MKLINLQLLRSILTILIIVFTLNSFSAISETLNYSDTSDYRIGINVSGLYSFNKSDIPTLWNASDCGKYNEGSSIAFSGGANLSFTILKNILWADLRLNYRYLPVNLTISLSDYFVYNPKTNTYVPLVINHELVSSINYLTAEPGIIFQPIQSVPFKIRLAFDAGYPLFGSKYKTTDEISSPRVFTFPDSTMKHTTQSGSLQNAGTSLGIIGGVMYEKMIANNLFLIGEINYRHPLNSALNDYQLTSTMIGLNVGIQYGFSFDKEIHKPKPVIIDTPKVIAPVIEPVLQIVQDTVKPTFLIPEVVLASTPIEVIETVVTHTYPLLPYIFFDSTSYYLKDKYKQKTNGKFSDNDVPNNALNIYNAMLDIIGSRMNENSGSTLIITGMSDGREETSSEELLILAKNRAEAVADYLISNWLIDKNRLIIKTRETPELATSTIYQEGYEENRRVEISTLDYDLLKPVIYSKFKEYDIRSDSLIVNAKIFNSGNVSQYEMSVVSGNIIIYNNIFKVNDSSFVLKLTPDQKEKIAQALNEKKNTSINFSYFADNQKITKSYLVDILRTQSQFELGRLNLIVFDFDKFEINDFNKKMINDFVANTIMDNSKVSITGSTDKLGEKDYNMNLSLSRAESTYKVIKKIKPKADFKEVTGIGNTKLLYDNSLPEGRFYCRTVLIEVTTPIN